jgi:hypothetical protein
LYFAQKRRVFQIRTKERVFQIGAFSLQTAEEIRAIKRKFTLCRNRKDAFRLP